ncbi:MAG: FG-GAP repeat domain-containing protein [Pirellulales bacterium]
MKSLVRIVSVAAAVVAVSLLAQAAEKSPQVTFKRTRLDAKFRSEGVAVGDFNHDGKLDIAAGSVYYAAPDWKMVPILAQPKEFQPQGYSDTFCNYAEDINGDGWIDLIVIDTPSKSTTWYENPKNAPGPWKAHLITPVTNAENPIYTDLDGDGKCELICGVNPGQRMVFVKRGPNPAEPWKITPISTENAPGAQMYGHGLGVGDVNGDGRNDVLVKEGWWESPADRTQVPWQFHPANFGQDCANMIVFDFDGDGDNDVLTTSAHRYGIWWHEQTPQGWITHEIDKSFSQTHAVCLADINGDGLMDFVTGKRWKAHWQGDPGGDEPGVMCWFEMQRKDGRPTWIKHQFDDDSGVGLEFDVVDVNGDGLLDVVTSNKKGTHYFQQVRQ